MSVKLLINGVRFEVHEGNPNAPRSKNHREVMMQECCRHPRILIHNEHGVYCPTCSAQFTISFDQESGEMTFWIGEPNDVHDSA